MANLIEKAAEMGSFQILMDAMEVADLHEMLESPGPLTILAPNDEAFQSLPEGQLEDLLQNQHLLKQILAYHLVPGDVREEDLREIEEAPTVEGSIVAVQEGDTLLVNDAAVLQTDILADNGVIHEINAVLIPDLLRQEFSEIHG